MRIDKHNALLYLLELGQQEIDRLSGSAFFFRNRWFTSLPQKGIAHE